jgi:hypothetical protein
VQKVAPTMGKDQIILANLCGRGDKDIFTVADIWGCALIRLASPFRERVGKEARCPSC